MWELAERLLPPGQAGDFNQALMELGARFVLLEFLFVSIARLSKSVQHSRRGNRSAIRSKAVGRLDRTISSLHPDRKKGKDTDSPGFFRPMVLGSLALAVF
jgi:hypothetical protein